MAVPPRFRVFSDYTVSAVSSISRATRYRKGTTSRRGIDVVAMIQAQRKVANLLPLDEEEVLSALVQVEDAYLAAKAANREEVAA